MDHNYTIYQQALDLQASGFARFSSITIGVGVAKYLQILLPQLAYIFTSALLTRDRLYPWLRRLSPRLSQETVLNKAEIWIRDFQRLQGFFVWKLACDLGFFLVVTEYGSWLRALTLSGLVTYTLFQYLVYHLIGQKLILSNLVRRHPRNRPKPIRTTWWKNLASKMLYEEMGVTISQVSGLLIIAKILVDYLAMWITWSAYTVGFFLFSNGGLGLSPIVIFPHVSMSTMYLSVYLGYAWSFTLLEVLLRSIAIRCQPIPLAIRKLFLSSQMKQLAATIAVTIMLPLLARSLDNAWKSVGIAASRFNAVQDQWVISIDDDPPTWKPNKAFKTDCGRGCIESKFSRGHYTTTNQ